MDPCVKIQLAASGRPTQAHQAQIETGSVILITPPSAKPPSNYNPHYYVYLKLHFVFNFILTTRDISLISTHV